MATTPRSSTSVSSASITPTPMDYSSPVIKESPSALPNENSMEATEPTEATHDLPDSRIVIKADIVKTSPFLQSLPIPARMTETPSTPTSILTPTMKRIKLKAIGKLLLPSTFRNNDRNNNNSKNSSSIKELSAYDSNGENETAGPPKKIGKIKSPFIENCNQQQQKQIQNNTKCMKFDYNNKTPNSLMALTSLENSAGHHAMDVSTNTININTSSALSQRKYQNNFLHTNGHYDSEDFSTDSGKENVDTTHKEQTLPLVEIRRKFSRKANTTQSLNNSTGSGITRQLTTRSTSLNGSFSTPQVEDKYAKYFGVARNTTQSLNNSTGSGITRQPTTRATSLNGSFSTSQVEDKYAKYFGVPKTPKSATTNQSQPMLPSPAVQKHFRQQQKKMYSIKRMVPVINELKNYEDIMVTESELKLALREFDSLLRSDSM